MSIEEQVKAFVEEIRPAIQSHGGDVEFVGMEGDEVTLKLLGACHACPHALMTLKNGIEAGLRERVSPSLTVKRADKA
jgi:Fe-S cluster biogenesis protein NfuA